MSSALILSKGYSTFGIPLAISRQAIVGLMDYFMFQVDCFSMKASTSREDGSAGIAPVFCTVSAATALA